MIGALTTKQMMSVIMNSEPTTLDVKRSPPLRGPRLDRLRWQIVGIGLAGGGKMAGIIHPNYVSPRFSCASRWRANSSWSSTVPSASPFLVAASAA